MLKQTKGDLFDGVGILVHQVNTLGVMGTGIALQMKNNILSPEQYHEYQELCAEKSDEDLMGSVLYHQCGQNLIAHCFAQKQVTRDALDTHYGSLGQALLNVAVKAHHLHLPVFIPGYLGCGFAGGNWAQVVYPMIRTTFQGEDVTIVYQKPEMLLEDFQNIKVPEFPLLTVPFMDFPAGTSTGNFRFWYKKTFGDFS